MKPEYFDFTDAKIVIAGGATGIGLAWAKAYVESGAQVLLFSRNAEKLAVAKNTLEEIRPGSCVTAVADISKAADMTALAGQIEKDWGRVNVAVNSAGFNIRRPLVEVPVEEFQSIIDVNLTGAFLFSKAMYPLLKKADYGRLIHVASIFAQVSFVQRTSYASSKGGVKMLAKTLALEWAPDKITVNTVSPGPFLTEINAPLLQNPEAYQKFCERIPMKRFGKTEEIVTAGLFLASKHSSYITGSDLVIDGGWTAS